MTIPQEIVRPSECYECGTPLEYVDMPSYAIDAERTLCLRCATRRGGTYDEAEGHWTLHPDLHDLIRHTIPSL
jgi:hypothetical protein